MGALFEVFSFQPRHWLVFITKSQYFSYISLQVKPKRIKSLIHYYRLLLFFFIYLIFVLAFLPTSFISNVLSKIKEDIWDTSNGTLFCKFTESILELTVSSSDLYNVEEYENDISLIAFRGAHHCLYHISFLKARYFKQFMEFCYKRRQIPFM